VRHYGSVISADPEAVREALAAAADAGPFFALGTAGTDGTGTDARDWRPASAVYDGGLRDLIDATGERLGVTEARVAAATVHLAYAARLWSPVLACALRRGLVPDLAGLRLAAAPSLRLRLPEPRGWLVAAPASSAALDACAADAGADAVSAPGEVAALAYRVVVGQHLEPLASGLAVKIAPGLLRGNAAAAMTAALRVLAAAHPEVAAQARAVAQALLATGMLRGTGELTGPGLEFRRRSCCLFYRVPGGGLCGDCPLPGPPARA
jgi:FhuF 2Fe-2S C-terminal domain